MTSVAPNADRTSRPAHTQWRLPVLFSAVFLISCVWVSSKKPFWLDELNCFYLAQDPSFGHMTQALAGGADTVPPLYYVSLWTWAQVGGVSELSLRLHSWLWLSLTFALIWSVLRRRHGYWPASAGCLAAFCLSRLVLYHNSEARFYGFFPAVVAFGIWVFDRVYESNRLSLRQAALIALAHAIMVLAHVFGMLYSGAILLAWILADSWQRRWRPLAYVSVAVGWLAFLPWLPIFRHQTEIFRHESWIPTPTVNDLLDALAHKVNLPLALILIVGFALLNRRGAAGNTRPTQTPSQEALFVLSVILIVFVPVALWIFSRLFRSVFWDRYMIPSTLGWAILLSFIGERLGLGADEIGEAQQGSKFVLPARRRQVVPRLLLASFLAFPLLYAWMHPSNPRPNAERLPPGLAELPIVLDTPQAFLPRVHYFGTNSNYYFILDWETAIDPKSQQGTSVNHVIIDLLDRYYSLPHVVSTTDFLSHHSRFLYFDQRVSAWFDLRVRQSGQYKLTLIPRDTPGMFLVDDGKTQVWLAERIEPG
jgi:Dolichyl-phosphate-mannose-protein mannosyltransferase